MNSPRHTKDLQTKHKTKVKRHWVYDPETGEEQELMFTDPLGKPVKESHEFIGDLFTYEEEEIR
jgi:hypothetical protein